MPTVYVTYQAPDGTTPTAAVETALSFHVFRAACLVEGVELPGGRTAVMPSAIQLVSLDPPTEELQASTPSATKVQPKPPAAERQREQAAAVD